MSSKPSQEIEVKAIKKAILPILLLFVAILSACNPDNAPSEPLVVVASPAALDSGFLTYEHDSGIFSIRIPPNWIASDLPEAGGVRVQFSQLEGEESVVRLTTYVVNVGEPMTRDTFIRTAEVYQPPADIANLDWQPLSPPVDQADNSRRVVGIRFYPAIGGRALNIFMQGDGSYFSALEVDVTGADEALLNTLAAVINTYRVNTDVNLAVGEITGITSASGVIGFDSYLTWTDRDGGFNITGRIINNDDTALEAIRLTGYLFDGNQNRLSEKSAILTTDVLAPGEGAPFRLRFEGGRPSTALRYELHAAARTVDFTLRTFYGSENFTVQENPVFYNTAGNLVLSGQLANTGSRLVRNVKIVISVLDNLNNVVAAETVFINKNQLLPGEADSYEIVIYDIGGAPYRYELRVMGTAE